LKVEELAGPIQCYRLKSPFDPSGDFALIEARIMVLDLAVVQPSWRIEALAPVIPIRKA
jgi:hypothetical protein